MVTQKPLYDPCGGHLGLDFTNSLGECAAGDVQERIPDYAALLRWSTEAGSIDRRTAAALARLAADKPRAASNVATRARALRSAIFRIFRAPMNGARADREALETFNAELARALSHARIAPSGDGLSWSWCDASKALEAPLWPLARASAELMASPERERVRMCAGNRCEWLFLDRSRNHRRRWCDMKSCGNLDKVRRHRQRKRTG